MKVCTLCRRGKPLDQFSKDKKAPDGKNFRCRSCCSLKYREWTAANPEKARAPRDWTPDPIRKAERDAEYYARNREVVRQKAVGQRLMSRYGITLAQYNLMLAEQNGRCAICNTDKPGGRSDRFHVDHDHETGEVRGLLCLRCNIRLAVVENRGWMADALGYLARSLPEDDLAGAEGSQ